jgi:hypothetical protein
VLPRRAAAAGRIQIGRYVVTGRIGRGGMGMVYRGVDEALEREAAIKTLISEGDAQSESRRRFAVEAKAAARLQHPNIVIVYELGEDRGIPFIAMELLSGGDLEGVLRGGEPLGIVEKLDVVAQVCRGLAFAHERGIVHRDIKPSNIRLLDDGTAKIMDFGIAKLGGTQLTKAGMMVGTVHYMSPEQVRGRQLDGRSDVFSVGVILYELLSGERPFRGEGTTQILYKIVHEDPSPLDLRALGAAGPELAAIVTRALAKEPADRYTAADLGRALGEALAELHRDEAAPPPTATAALAEARGQLRDGRIDEATATLRTLSAEHPGLVEAQRLLRTALRRQKERAAPAAPVEDAFPELEATFQATRTRHELATGTAPTVAIASEAEGGAPAPAPPAPRLGAGIWVGTAAILLTLAVAATGVLLHGRRSVARLRLPVRSQPAGAAVLVNGRDSGVVTDGVVELTPPPPARVELTFRMAGHRDETRVVALPLAGSEAVAVTLQPQDRNLVAVRTTPPGAALTLDGAPVGQSPTELAIDPDREHRLSLALDGFEPWELRIAKGQRLTPLDVRLQQLPPPGTVAITSPYPLDVLYRGRTLARNEKTPRVSVPGGRQVLTLVAPSVFLRAEVTVQVTSGGETTLAAPRTGRLNVRAAPDNCQVFVDGTFLDYPPILDRPVAAGRHAVGFRWPDGSRDQKVAEVEAGSPAFVIGQKPKE